MTTIPTSSVKINSDIDQFQSLIDSYLGDTSAQAEQIKEDHQRYLTEYTKLQDNTMNKTCQLVINTARGSQGPTTGDETQQELHRLIECYERMRGIWKNFEQSLLPRCPDLPLSSSEKPATAIPAPKKKQNRAADGTVRHVQWAGAIKRVDITEMNLEGLEEYSEEGEITEEPLKNRQTLCSKSRAPVVFTEASLAAREQKTIEDALSAFGKGIFIAASIYQDC